MKKIVRWIFIIIATPVLLLLAALTVASLLGITVNLDKVRPLVEQAASTALDRQVTIKGSVELLPTLNPRLEVQGVQIDNPEGWGNPDFVDLKLVRIQLELIDLFKNEISLAEVTAEGVKINLESRQDDLNNWSFATSVLEENKQETVVTDPLSQEEEAGSLTFAAVDTVSLKDISIHYQDTVLGKTITFQLDELSGGAKEGEPVKLLTKGNLQEHRYTFDIEAGALRTLRLQEQAWPLTLSGEIAGTPFSAKGLLEQENREQQLNLDVSLGAVDIGALLSKLKLAEEINASTEELGLTLQLKGDSLHELVEQSEFHFRLQGGKLTLAGSDGGAALPISNLKGNIGAKPGEAISLTLEGSVDATPVHIFIQGMPLINYISDPGQLPITITLATTGVELKFSGALELPASSKTFNLAMNLTGEQLDSLNEFLNIDLPPFGPYSLDAHFAATEHGYDLSNLAIKVGASDLTGSMSLKNQNVIPEIRLELNSNILQIDDFRLADWSPEGQKDSTSTDGTERAEQDTEQEEQTAVVPSFLSPESLARFNGTVTVEMAKVLSGKDTLGSGLLHTTLQDGRFSINPLQLDLADGTAKLEFSFYPTATEAQIHLASTVNKLDLGILARRAKEESTMGGILNLDIALDSTAPALKDILAYANGHFDLTFAPVNFDATLIDLWAVNLLSALASKVDEEPTSTINCLVASFAVEDGIMQERVIFMDTTRMSIEGGANINFKTEELKLKVVPKAKRPEFFSLATPVKVSGTFEDFGFGINKIRLTSAVASFLTSPVHVPLRRLFSGEIPADGAKACKTAWNNRNQD